MRLTRKKSFMVAGIIILAVAGGGLRYTLRNQPNPIPDSIVSAVTFPLYYPATLPAGYIIDQASFRADNQVVLYTLTKAGASNISVSIQSKPSGFDFNDFQNKQLRGTKAVANDNGEVLVGLYAERIVGSLLNDKSWVLVNASSKVSAKDIETIMKSLQPAK